MLTVNLTSMKRNTGLGEGAKMNNTLWGNSGVVLQRHLVFAYRFALD